MLEYWRRLSSAGYYVIGYDMTGHGRSAPTGSPLSLIKEWPCALRLMVIDLSTTFLMISLISFRHLVSDGLEFLQAVYSKDAAFGPKLLTLPYYISGIASRFPFHRILYYPLIPMIRYLDGWHGGLERSQRGAETRRGLYGALLC